MGLFWKPRISESEAARRFVTAILHGVRQHWSKVSEQFRSMMHVSTKLDTPWATLEFALAAIAVQMQALENLLPQEQAGRIRGNVVTYLAGAELFSEAEVANVAANAVESYGSAFKQAIDADEPPFGNVAATFCDRIQLGSSDVPTVGEFYSPLFLMALGGAITTTYLGWWKRFLATHRLVA